MKTPYKVSKTATENTEGSTPEAEGALSDALGLGTQDIC